MTDRELLELAAKAAGFTHAICHEADADEEESHAYCRIAKGTYWRPLTEGGDALRLAVKLNLQITIEDERCGGVTVAWGEDFSKYVLEVSENPDTTTAASCRAIVRAAAEIGKAAVIKPPCPQV